MALLDDLTKGGTPAGIAVGVGAALLAPLLAPAMSSVLRPAAKAVVRTGITLYRTVAEPVSVAVNGLVAEAQLELAAAPSGQTNAASPVVPEDAPRSRKRRGTHH